MGKVVVSVDGNQIGECQLDKERVTIGRHPDNDIVLQDDRACSGHHAVIITIMSDSFLEDLDSTNGTVVNGKQVSKHPLSNGDLIQIGRHTIKYEGKVTDYDADFEKTMILKPSEIVAACLTWPRLTSMVSGNGFRTAYRSRWSSCYLAVVNERRVRDRGTRAHQTLR